jgi:hypothetical protein
MKRVCGSELQIGGGCDERRRLAFFATDYQSALENFERITKTLTLLLVARTSSALPLNAARAEIVAR